MNQIVEQLYSKHFHEIVQYVAANFPVLNVDGVMTRMLVDLKECAVATDLGFRRWATTYVRRTADEVLDRQGRTLESAIEEAKRDTAPKPKFVYEAHPYNPDITFIEIRHGRRQFIWVIESSKLEIARILHPAIRVRFQRIGKHSFPFLVKICRQQTYSGAWHEIERDLASIWFNFKFSDDLVADDGWLNFLPGNIQVAAPELCSTNDASNPDAPPSRHVELRPETDAVDGWFPPRPTARPLDREKVKASPFLNPQELVVDKWLRGTDDARALDRPDLEPAPAEIAALAVDAEVKRLKNEWHIGI
jgi:hypothetical protein